jgi:hypothetical protein
LWGVLGAKDSIYGGGDKFFRGTGVVEGFLDDIGFFGGRGDDK